jgi:cytochrome b561
MAIIRHQYRRPAGPPRIPHLEQLALHAVILALALTTVLVTLLG